MKIEGPDKSRQVSQSGKAKGSTGSADGTFGNFLASGTEESAGAGMTSSIAHVDSLLAAQAVEDPAARASRGRMRQRAEDILGELDKIRLAMLGGNLTVGHMIDVADVIAEHREKISDPSLTAILDEIDLRAQVELAKMRVALDAGL